MATEPRKTWLEETLPAIMEKAVEEKSVDLFGDEVSLVLSQKV